MRLLVEIVIIGGLIYLGWEKPFKEWQNQVRAAVTSNQEAASHETVTAPAAQNPIPQPGPIITSPSQHGAWMWDPKRQSTLDRPAYGQTQPVQRYQDPLGRSYWIDAQGVWHYDQ